MRTRRVGVELFGALSTLRAALRRLHPPSAALGIRGASLPGPERLHRQILDRRVWAAEARVMALLNDDPGLLAAADEDEDLTFDELQAS